MVMFSGVRARGSGGEIAPQKFLFVKNLGKILKNLGKETSNFLNNIIEIILPCYWAYK